MFFKFGFSSDVEKTAVLMLVSGIYLDAVLLRRINFSQKYPSLEIKFMPLKSSRAQLQSLKNTATG